MTKCGVVGSLVLLALAYMLSAAPAATACGSGKILFSDNFAKSNPSWVPNFGKGFTFGTDGLQFQVPPQIGEEWQNQSSLYDGKYQVCVTAAVTYDTSDAKSFPSVGVDFFGVDTSNEYTSLFSPRSGHHELSRTQNGRGLSPVPWTEGGPQIPAGQPFEMMLTVNGNAASFYVNGTKLGDFTGISPQGGGLVGFMVLNSSRGAKAPVPVTLKKFEVFEMK